MPSRTYRSVGKLSVSTTIRARPAGRDRRPGQLVEQHACRVADRPSAPPRRPAPPHPSRSPSVSGNSSQPSSQPRISRPAPLPADELADRAAVAASGRPSELPSRYATTSAPTTNRSAYPRSGSAASRAAARGQKSSSPGHADLGPDGEQLREERDVERPLAGSHPAEPPVPGLCPIVRSTVLSAGTATAGSSPRGRRAPRRPRTPPSVVRSS